MATVDPKVNNPFLQNARTPVCRVFVYRKGSELRGTDNSVWALPYHVGPSAINPITQEPDIPKDFYTVLGWTKDLVRAGISIGPFIDAVSLERYTHDKWEVISAKVDITRAWSCSKAYLRIARPYEAAEMIEHPPVRPEDVIVVEMGYTESSISTVARMETVFYGIVDSVNAVSEPRKLFVEIIARDPLRYLVDNKIRGQQLHVSDVANGKVNRSEIIKNLIYFGSQIDYTTTQLAPTGAAHINTETIVSTDSSQLTSSIIQRKLPGKTNSYITLGRIEMSSRADPLAPPKVGGQAMGMIIADKFPLDLIKHIAQVETSPKEIFADPRTGFINYETRRTDARRLYSESADERSARNYYFRLPVESANILSIKEEWTTAGTVSNFVITNSQAYTSENTSIAQVYCESPKAHLDDPIEGEINNSKLRRFTRNRYVYDESLVTSETAAAVANSLFTIWGKDIRTGSVQVPGDETLQIGEAIRLWNTPLFGVRSPAGLEDDSSWGGGENAGVFRVEAVTHHFVSDDTKGFTSVFVFGPITPNSAEIVFYTGENVGLLTFFIKSSKEWDDIYKNSSNFLSAEIIQTANPIQSPNSQTRPTPPDATEAAAPTSTPSPEPEPESTPIPTSSLDTAGQ